MSTERALESLAITGFYTVAVGEPYHASRYAEFLETCPTVDEMNIQIQKRKWGLCGGAQFIFFHLQKIFRNHPEFQEKFLQDAQVALLESGMKPDHIDEFFNLEKGTNRSCYFQTMYFGEYNLEQRTAFYKEAEQFALDQLRGWLGINSRNIT